MPKIHRLISYLQDPKKVASFQRLCGVEAPPSWGSLKEGSEASWANGSCPTDQGDVDGGGGGGGGRHRFQDLSKEGEKGDGSHLHDMRNGIVSGEACGAESEQQPPDEENQHHWSAKKLRRNSLTGESVSQEFSIRSPLLYYIFSLGTELGNELFYILFFPFCIWNVDGWLGRRLIIVWVWVMYLGQCTKDIIRWPRPASPPVVKLEVFYNSEYSMPSTHAMSGTAIPVSLLLLSYGRWQVRPFYQIKIIRQTFTIVEKSGEKTKLYFFKIYSMIYSKLNTFQYLVFLYLSI